MGPELSLAGAMKRIDPGNGLAAQRTLNARCWPSRSRRKIPSPPQRPAATQRESSGTRTIIARNPRPRNESIVFKFTPFPSSRPGERLPHRCSPLPRLSCVARSGTQPSG